MRKKYVVRSVQASEDGVFLELVEYETTIEPRIEPIPKDETEKALTKILKGIEKVGGPLKKFYPPGYEPHVMRAWLSKEDYQKLGKPTIDDHIQAYMEKEEEN